MCFTALRVYAILTLWIQIVFEFPKLGHMLAARTTDVYTIFPPLPDQAVSGSSWWWLSLHLISATLLSFSVEQQVIWRSTAERRLLKPTFKFLVLATLVTGSIVLNSNHFGPAPWWVGILVQCTLIAIVSTCIFVVGLQSDVALAVFVLVFTIPNWLTLFKYVSFYGVLATPCMSWLWSLVGLVVLAIANVVPWFTVVHEPRHPSRRYVI